MNLIGSITIAKRLRANPVWERHDYGYCWIDLLLLANDADREVTIKNERVFLKRGQLAWSIRSLELEWNKSGEWIDRFLSFCKDHGMIKVEARKNRGTVITILNYDAYNPQKAVTEPDSEAVTEPDTKTEWKGEMGNGNRKGERASAPPERTFPEIPDDKDIQSFCADYRDAARGVTNGIGEVWWRGWLANVFRSNRPFPSDWKRSLTRAFEADLVARHPKAVMALSGGNDLAQPLNGNSDLKKNAAAILNGRSPAQARFELDKELKAVQERLDAAHEIGAQPDAKDETRERELKQALKELNGKN